MRPKKHLRVVSYGGGRQTAAMAVLGAMGKLGRVDAYIFANTGRELPHTYENVRVLDAYLRERGAQITVAEPGGVLLPALAAGPALPEPDANGAGRTLTGALALRKAVLPMYGSRGGMMPRRCTERYKIRVVRQAMRAMGATSAEVLLGISYDEIVRMKESDVQWARNAFPLIDLKLTADDCVRIVEDAVSLTAEQSACDICPHRTLKEWANIRERYPDRFDYAVEVEASYDGLYLHAGRKPLPVLLAQPAADEEEDGCTGGYCFV